MYSGSWVPMLWRQYFRRPSGVKWADVKVSLRPTVCQPLPSWCRSPEACGCVLYSVLEINSCPVSRYPLWGEVLPFIGCHDLSYWCVYQYLQYFSSVRINKVSLTIWTTFYYSYVAYFHNLYVNQQMHLIKRDSWHVSYSYMFRHRSAIWTRCLQTT